MKIDGRLLSALIIALALIPGAYAVELSGGISASSKDNGFAEGNTVADSSGITSTASSKNSIIDETHWITDKNKHAEVTLYVDGGVLSGYDKIIYPKEDKKLQTNEETVSAELDVTVTDAKKIKAGAKAWNEQGANTASVGVDVTQGSLIEYTGKASATATEAKSAFSASSIYGQSVEIAGHAQNDALSIQIMLENGLTLAAGSLLKKLFGTSSPSNLKYYWNDNSADFVVKKDNGKFYNPYVTVSATSLDLKIDSNTGTKTALILDPFQSWFDVTETLKKSAQTGLVRSMPVDSTGLYFDSIGQKLKDKGYAVTYYSNAAVSKGMIENQLGDYDISLVRSHGVADSGANTIYFSKYSEMDPSGNTNTIGGHEIKVPETAKRLNMIIFDACETFDPNVDSSSLANAVKKGTAVSLGHTGKPAFPTNNVFMPNFFAYLCDGKTVKEANEKASESVLWLEKLVIQGDENYRLPPGYWMVDEGHPIQPYIERAKPDSTVTIGPGTFYENLAIDKSLTIAGSGSTESGTVVDGSMDWGSVISIDPNINVNLYNMLIRNGLSSAGGGIYNQGRLTISDDTISGNSANSGGGIFNSGTATVTDSTISGNSANLGGGIFNSGTATVSGSTISGNSAKWDGGGIFNFGTATVTGSTISGNSAFDGGGICNFGTATVTGSIISGNPAESRGGGIFNSGTATVSGSTISGNSAKWDGGGINNWQGTATVTDSTISGNSANLGGGIYNSGTLNQVRGSITGNTAIWGGGGIFNSLTGIVNLNEGSITGNTAIWGGGIYNSGTLNQDEGSIIFGNSPNDIFYP